MTKTNSKKALLSSAFALVLSVAMLIGTTFAWFTDTASTAVNKIQAGNLDVALEMLDTAQNKWVTAEGKTLNFVKAGNVDEEVLWEPGATYELPKLRVVNKGNLALKYKIAITGIDGDSKLCKVIDWYYNDTEISKATSMAVSEDVVLNAKTEGDAFTLKGHMQKTAGNDYQGLSISGIAITVYATQATVESDSFNNQYDKDAEYAFVSTTEELEAAVAAGKNVILNSNLSLDKDLTISKDSTIIGNGHAIISNKPVSIAPDANVTIQNVAFASPTNSKDNASNLYAQDLKGKLVLDGCSFKGTQWDCIQVTPMPGSEIVINNCRFEAESAAQRFIHIQAADNSNADVKITLTNNFFGSTENLSNSMIDLDYINLDGIDFGGNNVYTDDDREIYVCGASISTTISSAEAFKLLGSKLVSAGDQSALNGAIDNAGTAPTTVKLEKAGTYTLPSLENKDITVVGTKDTVIDLKGVINKASSASFEGVTVEFANDTYKGFQHTGKLTYKDCTINGLQFLYADDVEFINCEFVQKNDDSYHIWTYGAKNVTFTDCKFYSTNNSKSILCYIEGAGNTFTRTFNRCEFVTAGTAEKSAIMINPTANAGTNTYIVNINDCTATGYGENGISGQTIVGVKETVKDNITVKINGTTVYTH